MVLIANIKHAPLRENLHQQLQIIPLKISVDWVFSSWCVSDATIFLLDNHFKESDDKKMNNDVANVLLV